MKAGKGDKTRPYNPETFGKNYDNIFRKKNDMNETPPTIEELESHFQRKPDLIDYPTFPLVERAYGYSLMTDKPRDEAGYSIDQVLGILKRLQGMTVVRVFESSSDEGTVIGYHAEPAYTTEEGIKRARWKWMDWIRGLYAGEKREYLDFYETK